MNRRNREEQLLRGNSRTAKARRAIKMDLTAFHKEHEVSVGFSVTCAILSPSPGNVSVNDSAIFVECAPQFNASCRGH